MRRASQRRSEVLRSAARFCIEQLEGRIFLSSSNPVAPTPILPVAPTPLQGVVGTPNAQDPQIFNGSYEFNQIYFSANGFVQKGDGTGQTIAIVDAFGSPTIVQDLETFDAHWGLSNSDYTGNFALTVQPLTPTTNSTSPSAGTLQGWAIETSLDVEWAHAVAPAAHILLVEAPSASLFDLLDANVYAARQQGVVSVSNSWGINNAEVNAAAFNLTGLNNDPGIFDGYFATPNGHLDNNGLPGSVVFTASSGDTLAQLSWPATSLSTISVGGMTVSSDINGNLVNFGPWVGQTVTTNGVTVTFGSGGGPDPNYVGTPNVPLVALDADTQTGVWVYSSAITNGWEVVGGTSVGSPTFAAYVAIIDQGLNFQAQGSIETQALSNAILVAEEGPAGGGYFNTFNFPAPGTMYPLWPTTGPIPDRNITPLAGQTGWGIPNGIPFTDFVLSGSADTPTKLPTSNGVTSLSAGGGLDYISVATQPTTTEAGVTLAPVVVDVNTSANTPDPDFNGPVTIGVDPGYSTFGGFLAGGTVTVDAVNGVAAFDTLSIAQTGSYSLKVVSPDAVSVNTNVFAVVNGLATHVQFVNQPGPAWQYGPIPAFALEVLDTNNNLVASPEETFNAAIVSGPANAVLSGNTTVNTLNGVATFYNLNVNEPGNYTFSITGPGFATLFTGVFQVVTTPTRKYLFGPTSLNSSQLTMQAMRNSIIFTNNGPPPADLVAAVAAGVGVPAVVTSAALTSLTPAILTKPAAVTSVVPTVTDPSLPNVDTGSATASLISSDKNVLGN
jgi:subtilase family serine protease